MQKLTPTQAALLAALIERKSLGKLRIENERNSIGGLTDNEKWEMTAVIPSGEWVDGYPGRRIHGCNIKTYEALLRAGLVVVRNGHWGCA